MAVIAFMVIVLANGYLRCLVLPLLALVVNDLIVVEQVLLLCSGGDDGVIIWFQWLIAFGVVVAGYVASAASVPVGMMVVMQVGSIR